MKLPLMRVMWKLIPADYDRAREECIRLVFIQHTEKHCCYEQRTCVFLKKIGLKQGCSKRAPIFQKGRLQMNSRKER